MGRIPGYYEWDDDDLTPGRKQEGGLHQNLYDAEGNLKGSARFVPTDGEGPETVNVTQNVYVPIEKRRRSQEQEEREEAIGELLLSGAVVDLVKAKPHVEKWWRNTFRPFVSAQRSKLNSRHHKFKDSDATTTVVAEVDEKVFSDETAEAGLFDNRPYMSSAEAQTRLLAALAARAYSDEQLKVVNNS
ncbi:hypothetical protein [Corynebacterium sanguinis]